MDPRRRQELTRYGAPAAFLAAVTIAVILIKAGLNGGSGSTTTVEAHPTTSTATKPTTTTTKLVLTGPQAGTTTTTTETTTPGAESIIFSVTRSTRCRQSRKASSTRGTSALSSRAIICWIT